MADAGSYEGERLVRIEGWRGWRFSNVKIDPADEDPTRAASTSTSSTPSSI